MLNLGREVELLRKTRVVVVIPFPGQLPRARGVMARGRDKSTSVHTYYTPAELKTVREAAKAVGLKYSEFSRWCCLKVAEQILQDVEESAQLELPLG